MESSCSICDIKKSQSQFSKSPWDKKDSRKCKNCLLDRRGECAVSLAPPHHTVAVEENTDGRSTDYMVPDIAVGAGHAQVVNGVQTVQLLSTIQDLQEENHRLKNELGMYLTTENKFLEDISNCSIVIQLQSEIGRLRKENEELCGEQQFRKEYEDCRVKLSILWSSKMREYMLARRWLINHCSKKYEMKDKLSDGAKHIILLELNNRRMLLNKKNNITVHLPDQYLIKEAIQSVSDCAKRTCYVEMYTFVFGDFEEEESDEFLDEFL